MATTLVATPDDGDDTVKLKVTDAGELVLLYQLCELIRQHYPDVEHALELNEDGSEWISVYSHDGPLYLSFGEGGQGCVLTDHGRREAIIGQAPTRRAMLARYTASWRAYLSQMGERPMEPRSPRAVSSRIH